MKNRIYLYLLLGLFLTACAKEPIASFTCKTNVLVGETISFTNSSTEATSYQWDFGDGSSSTSENPTHAYTEDGTFNVELTAKGDGGSSTASVSITVVHPDPVAGFTVDKIIVGLNETITFTNTSENATTYSWDFGDENTSTDEHPTHAYAEEGFFEVELTATGPGGATSTASNLIEVSEPDPVAGFSVDKTEAEVDEVISFTNTSANATSYLWTFGDGETSTDENTSHAYGTSGTYTVQLTASGPGGPDSTATETLTITWPDPVADFEMSKTLAEPEEVISFTNNSQFATSYAWDFGDGATSTDENPTHSFAAEGVYTVELTATNDGGSHSVSKDISIYYIPVAAFSVNNSTPEIGETINFTNESQYATSYLWDFDDGTTSTDENPTHSYTEGGTYSIQLTATGPGGSNSVTHEVSVPIVTPVNIFPGEGVRDIDLEETWGEVKPKIGDWSYLGNYTQPASGGGYYVIHVSKSNTYGLWIYMVSVTASFTLHDDDICFQVNCLDYFDGQTAEGIMIGSTKTEVEAAYGTAEDIDYDNDIWWYDSLGMNLRFDNSAADMIGIFPSSKKKSAGYIREIIENMHHMVPTIVQ